MLEIDLLAHLETLTGWKVYPIKVPQNGTYPTIVYKEIGNIRNSESSLNGNNLRTLHYEFVIVTPDSEELITTKQTIIDSYEGYSGLLGNTDIFIARIVSSVPTYDNAQNNFEYNITVEFTVKQ